MAKRKKCDARAEDSKMISADLSSEMEKSFRDYAMSVIVDRALPDVRDGLKPVHRRILYGMNELGVTPDKPHKKSARIVGEVMGKYHPHGDSSIYDAMVRMSQDFSMRYPLVDGHGNFGSIDGDGAAAQRYTEARMSPFSLEMVRNIEKDTVDFIPNFDGEEKEPSVLPARFPNLLVNGSSGIAVGMATSIPPHNLCEVVDACCLLIDKKSSSVEDLMECIKGPDFPTGGIVTGAEALRRVYETGQGKFTVRGKCEIAKGKRGKSEIIVTEIPYTVNKAKLISRIADLVKAKILKEIAEIRDESSREGMRIVIEIRKDDNPDIVLNKIYKHTDLQMNFSANMLALAEKTPKVMGLKELLQRYIDFQAEVVTRRTQHDLKKAEARSHILEGYQIALDNIDEIIRIIRSSYDDAKERMMNRFRLSAIQAQAILDMRLARLQGLEREKIEKEYREVLKAINTYKKILESKRRLMTVIKKELKEIADKWGDDRRTQIEGEDTVKLEKEDLVEEKDVILTLTGHGYIKKTSTFEEKIIDGDYVRKIITANTMGDVLAFTDKGRVYRCGVHEIPESKSKRGVSSEELFGIMTSETIVSILYVPEYTHDDILLIASSDGLFKRMSVKCLETGRKAGIIYTRTRENAKVVNVVHDTKEDVLLITRNGKAIRFEPGETREMGKAAAGVTGMTIDDDDEVCALLTLGKGYMPVIGSEEGYIKKLVPREIRKQARAGKGVYVWDKSAIKKTGHIVDAVMVQEGDKLSFISREGVVSTMNQSAVPALGRASKGRRSKGAGENIVHVGKIGKPEDVEKPKAVPRIV